MPSVDNRIVRMEFDNAAFERKISQTMTSLQKLNESLQMKGASKGLADVSAAAGKFNLNGVSEGIEGVSKKFIALSTIAITALAQITTAALRAGANMVKSFSFGPVIQGFQEFETNVNSIQTILANTASQGTNLQQVNAALDQLNEYSDKTIYNFSQMARNIGTFTAAGVDLDTSVSAIKGIANLAAISGSSSEQASTAMYQLSQALASGTVKLIDWNSVVNAGMGGEVFKNALFETGKAMGAIADVPLDQTFTEWEASGNNFRESLQDGWLTADVLTTTLGGISGELTEMDLKARGFSDSAAAELVKLGKLGVESATSVRTFTQLMGTIKESVASGWSASFRLLIGNFEESTKLFTGINNAIGGFVQRSADARNAVLEDWVKRGGRMVLIEGLQIGFQNLIKLVTPIKEAFRELFPAITGERLFNITLAFNKLMKALVPSEALINGIKSVFTGFFSILRVGWTIIKEGVKFVASLFGAFGGVNTSAIGDFVAKIGPFFKEMAANLVEGGGIVNFFKDLADSIKDLPNLLQGFKDKVVGLFSGLDPSVPDAVSESMGRFGQRFEGLKTLFSRIADLWSPFTDAMGKIFSVLDQIWIGIRDWFKELGQKIADNMDEGDFNAVLDAVNVALLGGIAALLAKFLKSGFKFDIGDGLFKQVGKSFEQLTGVLTAMQTNLKADALLKIAGAIAILTASVLVLSLIDSEDLTKALAAMAVGFSQLMGAFAILSKLALTPTTAVSFTILAAGMTVLAGAILILAAAMKILGTMDWNELAKGLVGVTVLLGALSLAAKPLAANSSGLLAAGVALIPIALALIILSKAVQSFADMEWGEMVQGLLGVVTGILGLGLAMRAFPQNLALSGVGLLLISLSLDKIAAAVEKFAGIPMGALAKGIISMSLALAGIGLAMQLMPTNLPITAAGLLILSLALGRIQDSLQGFGGMKWGVIGKGLLAMAATLVVLALAMNAMTGTVGGAVAIGIAAISLGVLFKVLDQFGNVDFTDLLKGLAGVALALGVLGAAAFLLQPVIPALLGLGAALILIGGGFALFGLGAATAAKAFELFAKVGSKGAEAFLEAMETMAKAIPIFLGALAEGLVEFVAQIAEMAPQLMESLRIIIVALIDELITLVPKLGELLGVLIQTVIDLLREKVPEYALLGVDILLALLQGIRDRIGDIVTVVGEIITEFLTALEAQIPLVVEAGTNLFVTGITSIAEAVGRIGATLMFGVGIALITGFIDGLVDQVQKVWNWISEFVSGVVNSVKSFFGISSPSTVFKQIGVDLLVGLLNGIVEAAVAVFNWFSNLGRTIISKVGNFLRTLHSKGYEIISGFFTGLVDRFVGVATWFGNLGDKVKDAIGDVANLLFSIGGAIINGLKRGAEAAWNGVKNWFGDRMNELKEMADTVWIFNSPSHVTTQMGKWIMQGFAVGMEKEFDNTAKILTSLDPASLIDVDRISGNMQKVLASAMASIADMDAAEPTITPVLDLSQIEAGMKTLPGMFGVPTISPDTSLASARKIALDTTATSTDDPVTVPSGEVIYNQTVNAPTKLSTADIYRETRNLLRAQKEALNIP